MKAGPIEDAKWQPKPNFEHKDGTVNVIWVEYIRTNDIVSFFKINEKNDKNLLTRLSIRGGGQKSNEHS